VLDQTLEDERFGVSLHATYRDPILELIPPCYSQSPLLTDFTPPAPDQSGLKLVCNVNVIIRKPQVRELCCMFMNSASGHGKSFCVSAWEYKATHKKYGNFFFLTKCIEK
jgi:hypothetical protein